MTTPNIRYEPMDSLMELEDEIREKGYAIWADRLTTIHAELSAAPNVTTAPAEIDALIASDHKRGCQGRTYSCSCGYDAAVTDALAALARENAELRDIGNLALANKNARSMQQERDFMIRKMREKYSAIEIADMVGLTRQRIHQILNEAQITGEINPYVRADRAEAECAELRKLLVRLANWDMMGQAADGPYWLRAIDAALAQKDADERKDVDWEVEPE